MSFDAERVLKPFQSLRKATKMSRGQLDPEHVHNLRTSTRRVEAMLSAVEVTNQSGLRKISRSLRKVRRAAGVVRDMDVLSAKAAEAPDKAERDCQVELLQHLGATRQRKADQLAEILKKRGHEIRAELKHCGNEIEFLVAAKDKSKMVTEESHAAARALELSSEMRSFRKLRRNNLHEYRKTGKQLRYVLQMPTAKDETLLARLRESQDAIGEWHDWEELLRTAKTVLKHGNKCGLIQKLQVHADESFEHALRKAYGLRKHVFQRANKRSLPLRILKDAASLVA
jgi:CHAD domain-containing protein